MSDIIGTIDTEAKDKLGDAFMRMILRQVERCLMAKAAGDEVLYLSATEGFLHSLPTAKRQEILDRQNLWEIETTRPHFKKISGGLKMGKLGDPLLEIPGAPKYIRLSEYKDRETLYLRNEEGNLELDDDEPPQINWSHPYIYSPYMVTKTSVHVDTLFTMCMEVLEDIKSIHQPRKQRRRPS